MKRYDHGDCVLLDTVLYAWYCGDQASEDDSSKFDRYMGAQLGYTAQPVLDPRVVVSLLVIQPGIASAFCADDGRKILT